MEFPTEATGMSRPSDNDTSSPEATLTKLYFLENKIL